MRFNYLQRLVVGAVALLLIGLTVMPAQAQDVIWERNARDGALASTPSWMDGGNERGIAFGEIDGQKVVVVASRTGGANIRIMDADTGADITPVTFDLTSVAGGLFVINDINFTEDGKLVVTNMTLDANAAGNPFKVYVFEPTGGAPIASYSYNSSSATAERFGDKASVFGSWTDGTFRVLAAQQTSQPGSILSVTTTDQGDNWTAERIALTAEAPSDGNLVGNTSVAIAANGDLLTNGNGSLVKRYSPSGEYREGQNIGNTGSNTGVKAFVVDGIELVAIYAYRGPVDSEPTLGYVDIFDVSDAENPVSIAQSPKMSSAASGNAINGDLDVRVDGDGSFVVYGLAATQGLIAFGAEAPEVAPTLAAFNLAGAAQPAVSPFSSTTSADNAAGSLVRGSGLAAASLNNGFSSNSFDVATFDDALENDKYLDVEIALEPGFKVDLSSIEYYFRRTNTGPTTALWAYSTDGKNFTAFTDNIDMTEFGTNDTKYGPVDLSDIPELQGVQSYSEITLRMFAWGASSTTGTGAFGRFVDGDDVVVTGTVEVDPDYVAPEPATDYVANLSGLVEVPANLSMGSGMVSAVLTGDDLVITGSFSGLTGSYTMSHIHLGDAGVNGGVIAALTAEIDSEGNGVYTAEDNTYELDAEDKVILAAGGYYINVHTDEFPAGEIRGQVLVSPNTAPTASEITAPAENADITVAGLAGAPFVPTWTAATDADDDKVVYVWQLSADVDFNNNLLTLSTGTNLSANLTLGAVDGILEEAGVAINDQITVYHRAVSTDGSALTFGDASSVNLTRGEIFDTYTIAEVRALDSGTPVTIEGIITRAKGVETRIQDATAGLNTFSPASTDFSTAVAEGDIAEGDLIRITGQRNVFNDQVQVNNITGYEVVSRGNDLPEAQLVTLAQIKANGPDYEGQLVRVEEITIADAGDVTFSAGTGSGKTYSIQDPSATAGEVDFRVPNQNNTSIVGVAIPDRPFTFEGVVGNFRGQFQLYAVNATDVIVPAQPLSGTYYIPQGTNERGFESLSAAVSALNEAGAVGEVTLYIDGDINEEDQVRINRTDLNEETRVTIKPAPGKTPTISLPLLKIVDTGFITIDGANGDEYTRDLTFEKNGNVGGLIGVYSDAEDVDIANINLTYQEDFGAGTYAIIINRHEFSGNTGQARDLVLYNVKVGSADMPFNDAIWLFGDATAAAHAIPFNTAIIDNEFHVGRSAIRTQTHVNTMFNGNKIFSYGFTAETPVVRLNTPLESFELANNEIVFVSTDRTEATTFIGFQATNTLIAEVYAVNNTFSTAGFTGAGTENSFYGFRHEGTASSANFILAHNTFRITDTGSNGIHTAVGRTTGASSGAGLTFINNIVQLERSAENTYAYQWAGTTLDASSNNIFNGGAGAIAILGEDRYATLAAWNTATGNDATSTSGSAQFVSNTNLRLTGSSIGDRNFAGVPLEMISTDIDGNDRSAEEPYKGAFESDAFGVSIESDEMPVVFSLNQNYPNPFNPTTLISYDLPVEANVQLSVYTVTGQLVTTLVNEARPAGQHQVNFDATRLASGVYIYRIIAGDFTQTQKMTLIK